MPCGRGWLHPGMKSIGVYEFGGPEALQVLELPPPQAGPGEVRIRVRAAAVNPTDIAVRSGVYAAHMAPGNAAPYVPGMDAAGVIDQLGPGADDRLAVGQRVVAVVLPTGPHGGAYAEQIVVPAASVVPAPDGVDFPAASTLLMNALTARIALDALAVPPGGTLAVTGAAGAVGGYTIELAKADGLTVIADAAPKDTDLVRGSGADHVVERGAGVASRIRALAPEGVAGLRGRLDTDRRSSARRRRRRGAGRTAGLVRPVGARAGARHPRAPGAGGHRADRHRAAAHAEPSGRGRHPEASRRRGAARRPGRMRLTVGWRPHGLRGRLVLDFS